VTASSSHRGLHSVVNCFVIDVLMAHTLLIGVRRELFLHGVGSLGRCIVPDFLLLVSVAQTFWLLRVLHLRRFRVALIVHEVATISRLGGHAFRLVKLII